MKVSPVILCGGVGARLWPLSRAGFPKQFLVLSGVNSLFQQAVERLACITADDIELIETRIVTNEEHRFLVLDQLREIKSVSARLLLEPVARNTAPALTMAALDAMAGGDDPVLVVTPADQTVVDLDVFTEALQSAVRVADSGAIVILGISPDRPETGYGYIKAGAGHVGMDVVLDVERFVEKPDLCAAQQYLAEGNYYWNGGMFVLRASVWLKALSQYRPDIAVATEKAWQGKADDLSFVRPDRAAFAEIPDESIDYAVMEPLSRSPRLSDAEGRADAQYASCPLRMVPLSAGWNDLGSWESVWQVSEKDLSGNFCLGDAITSDTENTLVHATSRLVGVVGVKNLIVIETPDAVLVADKSQSQHVKQIVLALERQSREESALHRKVHRPWGWYDSIDVEDRFKVKRIQVKPKASLSLQKHYHRAEHWIVVKGTAEITCGEKVITLTENQSTYIPLGEVHRLSNPGTIPLEIIEVQSGSYLGEDDIVRFDDTYGRGMAVA